MFWNITGGFSFVTENSAIVLAIIRFTAFSADSLKNGNFSRQYISSFLRSISRENSRSFLFSRYKNSSAQPLIMYWNWAAKFLFTLAKFGCPFLVKSHKSVSDRKSKMFVCWRHANSFTICASSSVLKQNKNNGRNPAKVKYFLQTVAVSDKLIKKVINYYKFYSARTQAAGENKFQLRVQKYYQS